ncbi:Hypothetical protein A7982_11486 [Minicystis rosea]|nr:Hypothetical protein A7982_11486 [Minicystis rosea]
MRQILNRFSAAAIAAALTCAPSLAKADALSLDACETKPDSPEIHALVQAGHDLGTKDAEKVRTAVADVRKHAAGDPFLLLWAGSLLASLPDPSADAVFDEAVAAAKIMVAKEGAEAAPIAAIYEAAALIRKHRIDEGAARLAEVTARPDAHRKYACRFIPAAMALADAGRTTEATALLARVQEAAPRARSVADARIEIAVRARDTRATEEAFTAALAQFPRDVEFTVRRANRVKIEEGRDAALALLDPLLLAGEASPSLLGEYLGLLSADPTEAKLAAYLRLAEAHPGVPALQMMVGVIHHYLHHYEESTRWLKQSGTLIDSEPRVAMYMAMNAFHTPGHEAEAEVLIDRAARAGRPDPDIYYCRAVIEVRRDPAEAARDLDRYLSLTEPRPDVAVEKQARVKQTLALLSGCASGPDPRGCVQREVVEQARALAFAEHFGKPPAPTPPAAGKVQKAPVDSGRTQAIAALLAVALLTLAYQGLLRDRPGPKHP